MDIKEKIREYRQAVTERLPEAVVVIAYMEHQVDVLTKALNILYSKFSDQLTPEEQEVFDYVNQFLSASSVNFDNLQDPIELDKLQGAADYKNQVRVLQRRYINLVTELHQSSSNE